MTAVSETELTVGQVGARIACHRENGAVDRITIRHDGRVLNRRGTAP